MIEDQRTFTVQATSWTYKSIYKLWSNLEPHRPHPDSSRVSSQACLLCQKL